MASLSMEHGEILKLKANTPHFFKIILDKTLRDGKLGLPCKFVRNYGNDLPSSVQFNVFDGAVWQVELTKSANGEIWWKKGWQEFVDHYSLARGHLLLFEFHHRTCHFNVLIFDKSASEIDYPPCNNIIGCIENNIEEECQELQTEGTENDDAPVEILDNNFSCLKSKGKSSMPVLKSHKKMKVENSSFHGSIRREVEGNRGYRSMPDRRKTLHAVGIVDFYSYVHGGIDFETKHGKRGMSCHKQRSNGIDSMKRSIPNEAKANVIQRAIKSKQLKTELTQKPSSSTRSGAIAASGRFSSTRPFFRIVMRSYYLKRGGLYVPVDFMAEYTKQGTDSVMLEVENRQWPVKIISYPRNCGKLSGGWVEFARENSLQVGDVCILELMNGETVSIKVSIFRN